MKMKKLICLLLLANSGFIIAQTTKTLVTPNGEKIQINPDVINTADNGLTKTGANVQLGGTLTKPTTIATGSNPLSITGLPTGAATDNVLITDASGVVKSIPSATLTSGALTKGNLSSPKATIAVTGGTSKLLDSNASIDIAPGTTGQILITDNTNNVKWGTIADVKGLLVKQGSGQINASPFTIPFTDGTSYTRFFTGSITVTGPSTIIVRATIFTTTSGDNERAIGNFRMVDAGGNLLDPYTALTPYYLESKNYPLPAFENAVPYSANGGYKGSSTFTITGSINAPAAGTYNFYLECNVAGFSNYSDNIFKPTGTVRIGYSGFYNPYYSYEVYNK